MKNLLELIALFYSLHYNLPEIWWSNSWNSFQELPSQPGNRSAKIWTIVALSFLLSTTISCDAVKKEEVRMESNSYEKIKLKEDSKRRIEFLIGQDFPQPETKLFKKLLQEIPKYVDGENNQVSEIAISLASLIPEKDFEKIFMSKDIYIQQQIPWREYYDRKLIKTEQNQSKVFGG